MDKDKRVAEEAVWVTKKDRRSASHVSGGGPLRNRGRVLRAFFVVTLLLSASPTPAQDGKSAGVRDSILGVKIGTSLEEARAKLKDLGTTGGRDTRGGGRKEQWNLKETDFAYVVYKTNAKGRVTEVTGFVRPGREMPFSELGDTALAAGKSETGITWNVSAAEGGYRLVAKGPEGKARVLYLLSLPGAQQ